MTVPELSPAHAQTLRGLGISALYVFGSRAEGVETPLSDYDYAVLLRDLSVLKNTREKQKLYDALYDILSDISPRTLQNDVIDIVFLQNHVSLELQANVVKRGKLLFDENPRARAAYEEQVMVRAADFAPILRIFDEAILARI